MKKTPAQIINAAQKAVLTTVCMYCKDTLREQIVEARFAGTSHGVCPKCYASVCIPQLKALKHK